MKLEDLKASHTLGVGGAGEGDTIPKEREEDKRREV